MDIEERLKRAERAQRLNEWIIIGCTMLLAVIALSFIPDLYDAIRY